MKTLIRLSVLILALTAVCFGADKTLRVCNSTTGDCWNVVYHDNGDGTYSPTMYSGGGTFAVTLPALSAGDNNIGNVDIATLPATVSVLVTPTITAGAYTAKECLGGKLTVTNAVPANNGSGVIQSVVIIDKDNETPSFDLFFFKADPATVVADNAPLAISDADLINCIGVVQFRSTDYIALSDNSVGTKGNLGLPFVVSSGQNLYLYIQYNDTDAFTATSDIQLLVNVLPN